MLDQRIPDGHVENRAATRPLVPPAAQRRRLALIILIPILLVLLLVVGLVAGYNLLNQGKVFSGVSVGDVNLSGMTTDQARTALTARYGDANTSHGGVTLDYGDRQWPLSAAEVGVAFNVDRSVALAMNVGRSDNLLADLGQQWSALRSGVKLEPAWQYDQSSIPQVLVRLHSDVDRPAVNASMSIAADGSVNISKSQTGLRVNDQATEQSITAALQQPAATNPHVNVVVTEQAPAVSETDWNNLRGTAHTMLQPIYLHATVANFSYTINTSDIAPMLTINPAQGGAPANLSLDPAQLDALTARIEPQIDRDPTDASFQLDTTNGLASISPEAVGHKLDRAAAAAAIRQAAADPANRTIDLPVTDIQPTVHAADLTAIRDRANELMQGFNLNYVGGPWIIKADRMAVMLQVKRDDSSGKPTFSLAFDQTELNRKLQVISATTDRTYDEALYRLGPDNRPYIATPAVDGRAMNIAATTQAINDALDAGQNQADVKFNVTPAPTFDISQPITFPDTLADAWTDISVSSLPRRTNVTIGTNSFNNTLIPPGGIYSASDAFGPIDAAHGYQTGYAIMHDPNGNLSTEPAVGGGICQVVTTFFQTAWWTGLPVVQRTNHSYWISLYGTPPLGRMGLDATVYQYDVDLKMKNTTGNWLLVHSWVSKDLHVHFQMLGTNPHWAVKVSNPIITNVVQTNATPIYTKSDQLPAGASVLVSHHQNGFDASISRQVYDAAGNKIDDITMNSHYQPVYDEYLVGTGGATSAPKPTATPAP